MEMTKAFYVVMVSEDWYRLHVTSTHYCLGAGSDLKALLRTVERLTKKYRSEHKLLKGLSQMEDGGQVNDSTYVLYEKDYKDLHKYFDSKVETTVVIVDFSNFNSIISKIIMNDIFESFKFCIKSKNLSIIFKKLLC